MRRLAILGFCLQSALPLGMAIGAVRMFGAAGHIADSTSQAGAAEAIRVGMGSVFAAVATGLLLGALGALITGIAVLAGRYRARWVLRLGRCASVPWLIFFPVGTIFGVLTLVYLSRHRREFESDLATFGTGLRS